MATVHVSAAPPRLCSRPSQEHFHPLPSLQVLPFPQTANVWCRWHSAKIEMRSEVRAHKPHELGVRRVLWVISRVFPDTCFVDTCFWQWALIPPTESVLQPRTSGGADAYSIAFQLHQVQTCRELSQPSIVTMGFHVGMLQLRAHGHCRTARCQLARSKASLQAQSIILHR
eukprot:COSAG02_NODE_5210_length_4540_cov_2.660662_8_plen_171_part_00